MPSKLYCIGGKEKNKSVLLLSPSRPKQHFSSPLLSALNAWVLLFEIVQMEHKNFQVLMRTKSVKKSWKITMDIGYDYCLPRSTRSAFLLFSYQTSFPYLKTNCQILSTTGQHFFLSSLFKILLKMMYISNGKKKVLKHFLCLVRSYRTVSIGFSGKIGMLTGKVKFPKRQKDSRVCNKYLLSAW